MFTCPRCGLADRGFDEIAALGVKVRPCQECEEHFRRRAGSSSTRRLELTTSIPRNAGEWSAW